jgi:hypothetical protein
MLHQLVGGSDLRLPRLGIHVPEKEVAGEGHPVPDLAAEQCVDRGPKRLPHKIQTPKLYGGMKLGAVLERIVANEVGLETFESTFRALPSSPHLAKPDKTVVGLYLDYGMHEASPVGPACMQERRLQWDRYGGCSYVGNLQGSSYADRWIIPAIVPRGPRADRRLPCTPLPSQSSP